MATHRLCVASGCGKDHFAKGWCRRHYYLLRDCPKCEVSDCSKPAQSKGYCSIHYARYRRNGDPLAGGIGRGEKLGWLTSNAGHTGYECLSWPFAYTHTGYGVVAFGGKQHVASRVMCELAHGKPESPTLQAAHSCGNGKRGCLNPMHLRWATVSENHLDAVVHGTHTGLQHRGSAHPLARLDELKVLRIRDLYARGKPQARLSEEFDISSGMISRIVNRKAWIHI